MVVFAGLLQQFPARSANIANIANSIQQSLTGARRVFEVLDAPSRSRSPERPPRCPARGEVQFEHVGFAYERGEPVLRDYRSTSQPGECVAIVGATGSGKSTLLSLIRASTTFRGAACCVDGHDVRDLDLDDLRRNIGIVFQESFLFSNTVAANIAFGHPAAARRRSNGAAEIAAAHEFIAELPQGYDTVLGEGGADLSGGQRQRLAIARALLLDPAILLLDDPTAAVDPQTEHEILEAIESAMRGRTTLLVAHRISALRRADRIVVLQRGRIVQEGTHEELLRTPGYFAGSRSCSLPTCRTNPQPRPREIRHERASTQRDAAAADRRPGRDAGCPPAAARIPPDFAAAGLHAALRRDAELAAGDGRVAVAAVAGLDLDPGGGHERTGPAQRCPRGAVGAAGFAALAVFTQVVLHYRQRLALELGEAVVFDLATGCSSTFSGCR